jgi:mRNA-degrading endonuclease RelE of RelBE toxin-antitoxin system
MKIIYAEKAEKQLKRIWKGNRNSASMIMNEIESYAVKPGGVFDIKLLKGRHGNFKRLRVGNYRVIFSDEENAMLIYEIKHRQEAYHD